MLRLVLTHITSDIIKFGLLLTYESNDYYLHEVVDFGKRQVLFMITSTSGSRVKRVALLQQKSRARNGEHVFVAEGIKMFAEAPYELIQELYIEEKLYQEDRHKELAEKVERCRQQGCFVETVTEEVLHKMSDTKTPQGIVCVMKQLSYSQEQMVSQALKRQKDEGRIPLFLLLEDIQDPGNLGTMIRTAEGAGVDGVFMTRGCVDIYNPKTIRSTMGSLYRVPFLYLDSLERIISCLKESHIKVYAAHLKGEKYYYEMDYHEGCAFLIGNEGNGLQKKTADMADCYVKIPMEGNLESLNAAIAAAILLYQIKVKNVR